MRPNAKTKMNVGRKTGSREHYGDRATRDAIPRASAVGKAGLGVVQGRVNESDYPLVDDVGWQWGTRWRRKSKVLGGPKMEMGWRSAPRPS